MTVLELWRRCTTFGKFRRPPARLAGRAMISWCGQRRARFQNRRYTNLLPSILTETGWPRKFVPIALLADPLPSPGVMGAAAVHQVCNPETRLAEIRPAQVCSAHGCCRRSASLRSAAPRLAWRRSARRGRLPRRCARRTSAPNSGASIRLVVTAPGQGHRQRHGEHRDPLQGHRMVARRPLRDAAAAVVPKPVTPRCAGRIEPVWGSSCPPTSSARSRLSEPSARALMSWRPRM